MKVRDIGAVVQKLVPLELAQGWDNVGLLVGDPQQDVTSVLLTIDVTKGVIAEARRLKTNLILSYHPIIWDGLKGVAAGGPGAAVYELVRSGISVFSIHTALDALWGGVNDGLAEILGIADAVPIGDLVSPAGRETYRLVVFVPVERAEAVSKAMFEAGAGAIGNYSHCGFQTAGTGTFLPLEGAHPALGRVGKVEQVRELRFETVVMGERLAAVLAAMKKAHPYETPAFDVIHLNNKPECFGLGRIGNLAQPLRWNDVLQRIRKVTGAKAAGIVGRPKRLVKTAAVGAGSCGKLIDQVIAAGVDLYLTGELKHHQALAAQEAGLTCICLSHTVSERFILKKLAGQLHEQLPKMTIKISKEDHDPFTWMTL